MSDLNKQVKLQFIAIALLLLVGIWVKHDRVFAKTTSKPAVTERPVHVQFEDGDWQPCKDLPGCQFMNLYGNPSQESHHILARLQTGTKFPRHWHTGAENYVGLKGMIVFYLEQQEKTNKVILSHGDYLHYQGGLIHWGQCVSSEDCMYYVFNDSSYDITLVD